MNKRITKIETIVFWFFVSQIILISFGFFCKTVINTLSETTTVGSTILYACAYIFDIALEIKSGISTIILQFLFGNWAITIEIIFVILGIFFCINYLRKILF